MTTVCMQTVVSSKTVQVVLLAEQATAKIYMVNSDGSSQQPRAMSVREYLGLSGILCLRHNMLPRRVYASQTESPAGGSAGDSCRAA